MLKVWVYESEVRGIAHEAACWTGETGGDLFGVWEPEPVILLATHMGPNSRREARRCRFDLQYVERLSRMLAVDWGLDYFGDWHSHGFSDVNYPSRIDRERIGRVMARNQFPSMLEIICTNHRSPMDLQATVSVHGFHFPAATWYAPTAVEIVMLPGLSPIREVFLRGNDDRFDQDWNTWNSFPLSSINGFNVAETPDSQIDREHRKRVCQRASELLGELGA